MKKIFEKALTYDDVQILPRYSNINSRENVRLSTSLTKSYRMNTPLISAPMDSITEKEMMIKMHQLGGIGFLHRFLPQNERLKILKEVEQTLIDDYNILDGSWFKPILGVTIGVKDEDINFIEKVFEECYQIEKVILIDIAHGHCELMKKTISRLSEFKKTRSFEIIAGNVATYNATKDLIDWGADAVKVGIGSGSLCTTRVNTGVGIPMITSIMNCVSASNGRVPIIADGGIRTPGDVAKALAAGASSCMLGGIISGTKETPGEISREGVWPNEVLYKKYRGSASVESKLIRGEENKNVEGVSTLVLYKGKVERIIEDICAGVKSSMSYVGVDNLKEFSEVAQFVEITNSGIIEASPHGKRIL